MPTADQEIDRLAEAVLAEARADAEQIRSGAQVKGEAVRQEARARANAEARDILQRATQEADRIRRQTLASAELKARLLGLEHREKLLDGVFEAAHIQLGSVSQWKDYDQVALQLAREAVTHLGAHEARIRADSVTRQHLAEPALGALSRELGVQLTLDGNLEHGLGVVVETTDGRMHYDNTFETRLARLRGSLRSAVHHILMGETL